MTKANIIEPTAKDTKIIVEQFMEEVKNCLKEGCL